jgi:hypothetical protein
MRMSLFAIAIASTALAFATAPTLAAAPPNVAPTQELSSTSTVDIAATNATQRVVAIAAQQTNMPASIDISAQFRSHVHYALGRNYGLSVAGVLSDATSTKTVI